MASRITYMSESLSAASVTVTPNVTLSKPYVTLKNLTMSGSLSMTADADYDSVFSSALSGGLDLAGSDNCVIAKNTIGGSRFNMRTPSGDSNASDTLNADAWCVSDTVRDCSIAITSNGSGILATFRQVKHLVYERNHCTLTSTAGPPGESGLKFFHTRDSQFRNSYWSISTACASSGGNQCDEAGWVVIRDRSYRNLFSYDTLLASSSGDGLVIHLNQAGNSGNQATEFNNNFEHTFIKNMAGSIVYQDGIQADTLLDCVFVASGNALHNWLAPGTEDTAPALIRHCTFVTTGTDTWLGGFSLENEDTWNSEVIVRDNIFVAAGTNTDPGYGAGVYRPGPDHFDDQVTTLDYNLYWYGENTPISYHEAGIGWSRSDPGTAGSWYALTGYDAHSQKGDPDFTNATLANFDYRPQSGSPAIDGSWPDGYVGADGYAPGAVSSLTAGSGRSTIAVSWNAPGDDGGTGTAVTYDLRMSMSSINEGNFYSANPVAVSAPQEAGATECVQLAGLNSCTWYYFALKTTDDMGNVSAISNVASAKTRCTGSLIVDCGGFLMAENEGSGFEPASTVAFALEMPSPSPAVHSTSLRYSIPEDEAGQPLEVSVYDVSGRLVRELERGSSRAGTHSSDWDLRDRTGKDVRAGLYFVRVTNGRERVVRSVVVAR
jgi:hypothetical protein